ncbi:hypothetical protein R3P38DRAFT_2810450 [Favolaschia claudopus]|uniref:Uncharacterized protein n=1 Tax=Favolaschia claudopus TaxID=2862362 RepID=A0AAV9ZAC6_9AGAR
MAPNSRISSKAKSKSQPRPEIDRDDFEPYEFLEHRDGRPLCFPRVIITGRNWAGVDAQDRAPRRYFWLVRSGPDAGAYPLKSGAEAALPERGSFQIARCNTIAQACYWWRVNCIHNHRTTCDLAEVWRLALERDRSRTGPVGRARIRSAELGRESVSGSENEGSDEENSQPLITDIVTWDFKMAHIRPSKTGWPDAPADWQPTIIEGPRTPPSRQYIKAPTKVKFRTPTPVKFERDSSSPIKFERDSSSPKVPLFRDDTDDELEVVEEMVAPRGSITPAPEVAATPRPRASTPRSSDLTPTTTRASTYKNSTLSRLRSSAPMSPSITSISSLSSSTLSGPSVATIPPASPSTSSSSSHAPAPRRNATPGPSGLSASSKAGSSVSSRLHGGGSKGGRGLSSISSASRAGSASVTSSAGGLFFWNPRKGKIMTDPRKALKIAEEEGEVDVLGEEDMVSMLEMMVESRRQQQEEEQQQQQQGEVEEEEGDVEVMDTSDA